VGAPIAGAAALAIGLALSSHFVGEARVGHGDDAVLRAARADASDAGIASAPDAGTDAAWRYEGERLVRAPADEEFVCRRPALEIPQTAGCERGGVYPRCKWQLPDDALSDGLYEVWRSTTPEHRWARPGLVALVLAAAADYQRRWPGEHLTIGDLDAPGPRHQTHDRGHDVDLYLLDAMIARNEGGGRYPDNYENRSASEVRSLRARVMDLAKILAVCADGDVRIYYNDPEIVDRFEAWFAARGLVSDVGRPMQMHNPLHRFHYHLTVSDDLEPLPLPEAPSP
jgi:hypothetical protein